MWCDYVKPLGGPCFPVGGFVGGGLVASIAILAQAVIAGQNGQGPVNNNQRTVNQTVNFMPFTPTACVDRQIRSRPNSAGRPRKPPRVGSDVQSIAH